MSILTRRTLVYGELETTYGVSATMSDSTSAMMCEAAEFMLSLQKIARPQYRADMSPVPDLIGQKIGEMKFAVELRGNGTPGTESRLGRLLRACSMVPVTKAVPWFGPFLPAASPAVETPSVAWSSGGTITGVLEPKTVLIQVTTGGVSGSALASYTYDDGSTQETGVALTSGSPHTLTSTDGTLSTATVTPTFAGTLQVGEAWIVKVYPAGIQYLPTSDATTMKSITLNMYKDGVLHQINGAYGTFKVQAKAGQRATVDFNFKGFYSQPTDVAFPAAPVFESTLPQQVELGRLHIDGFGVAGPVNNPCVVDAFSFDMANKIDPRMSINAANGYTGFRIVERMPVGGIDPEATLVGVQNFWDKLATARVMPFAMRVGTASGNSWDISAPAVQYTGLTYRDRAGIQALDAGLMFTRVLGDDEIQFYAC